MCSATAPSAPAALNYVAPGRQGSVRQATRSRTRRSTASASRCSRFRPQGVLPWGLAAGKPAVALGVEDRLEQQRNQRDPLQLGASGVFESGNFSQYAGEYNVQEGFLEARRSGPEERVRRRPELQCARAASPPIPPAAWWKPGRWAPPARSIEDIKLRTTLSSDIRAPGIGELFSPTSWSAPRRSVLSDWRPELQRPPAPGRQPLLCRNRPRRLSGGIVLTPHWIENLSMSFDWYSITLHDGIFSPSSSADHHRLRRSSRMPQVLPAASSSAKGSLVNRGWRRRKLTATAIRRTPLLGGLDLRHRQRRRRSTPIYQGAGECQPRNSVGPGLPGRLSPRPVRRHLVLPCRGQLYRRKDPYLAGRDG